MELEPDFLNRYPRQFSLKEIGIEGQQALRNARIMVVGAGGLGCPALQYLVAAGTGSIGIVDGDKVALSNLQRQTLYTGEDISEYKVQVAAARLGKINPHIVFETFQCMLSKNNAEQLLSGYDIILDCTDNFETRYLIDDTCSALEKPWIYGSVSGFEGQLACFNYPLEAQKRSSRYRDLFPSQPLPGDVNNCETAGVLGAVPGIIGSLQALEAIKYTCKTGVYGTNALMVFNALSCTFNTFNIQTKPKTSAE